jgi:hypothetical protein
MHMVRHQAPSPYLRIRTLGRRAELVNVELVIRIGEKHLLAPVPTLRNVMSKTGNNDAGETGHERIMALNTVTVMSGRRPVGKGRFMVMWVGAGAVMSSAFDAAE